MRAPPRLVQPEIMDEPDLDPGLVRRLDLPRHVLDDLRRNVVVATGLAQRLAVGSDRGFAIESFDSVSAAVDAAIGKAGEQGLVVVAGSFETVRLTRQLASISAALETDDSWSSPRGPKFG